MEFYAINAEVAGKLLAIKDKEGFLARMQANREPVEFYAVETASRLPLEVTDDSEQLTVNNASRLSLEVTGESEQCPSTASLASFELPLSLGLEVTGGNASRLPLEVTEEISAENTTAEEATNSEPEVKKMVMVIPVKGAMSRYGDLCSHGTETIARWLKQADSIEEIAGTVLEGDTGGGEVNGTKLVADTIRDCKKPVVGLIKGMVASAGMWAFSGCDKIYMEPGKHSRAGSIGVLCFKETITSSEVKYEIIRAEGSEQKALFNSVEELPSEERTRVMAHLKELREEFTSEFAKNRKLKTGKTVPKEAFTAQVWGLEDSLRLNLADEAGGIEDAIKMVIKLSS